MASLTDVVLGLVGQYGYLAVFCYMALETSLLLHFVPSELVVPFAAARLVHGPVTFVLFVADATLGATAGSLFAYYAFGVYGERVLSRYGRYVNLSSHEIERAQGWFQRWGEPSVFWGRFVPVLRAVVSVPAGLAHMDRRRFVLYSAAGAGVFNVALTFVGVDAARVAPGVVARPLDTALAVVHAHPVLAAVLVALGVGAYAILHNRDVLRDPDALRTTAAGFWALLAVRGLALVLLLAGAFFLQAATFTPASTLATSILAPLRGLGPPALLLTVAGVASLVLSGLTYELGRRLAAERRR